MSRRRKMYSRRESESVRIILFLFVLFAVLFWIGGLVNSYKGDKVNYTKDKVDTYYNSSLQDYIESEGIEITDRVNYDFSKLSCPEDIYMTVDTIVRNENIPTFIWYTIVGMESEFNPKSKFTKGEEVYIGLFGIQNNRLEMYHPINNVVYALPKLKEVYTNNLNSGLEGLDLAILVAQQYEGLGLFENTQEAESLKLYIKSKVTQYYHELQLAEIWE